MPPTRVASILTIDDHPYVYLNVETMAVRLSLPGRSVALTKTDG